MMQRRIAQHATLLAAFTLTAGCALFGSGSEILERDDGTMVLVGGKSGNEMDAVVQGRLARLSTGCLGLTIGGYEYLVAWPSGTQVTKSGKLVLTIGSEKYELGDEIRGAGGTVDPNSGDIPPIPKDCAVAEISYMDRIEN